MKHKALLLYSWFIRTALFFLPDIPIIMRLRGYLYSFFIKNKAPNFQVAASSTLKGLENISIGANCFCASNTIIDASVSITLEKDVMIGYSSILVTGNHSLQSGSYRYGPPNRSPIIIRSGSWIGANCVILAGAVIPQSSCIAAGTVVTKKLIEPGIYYRNSPLKHKE